MLVTGMVPSRTAISNTDRYGSLCSGDVWDDLRDTVRDHLHHSVSLLELEHQPGIFDTSRILTSQWQVTTAPLQL